MKSQVDVLVACLAYGGNGGIATVQIDLAFWLMRLAVTIKADPRISRVQVRKYGDVPLTMERNRIAKEARDGGFDMVFMLDNDNQPDLNLDSPRYPWAKPFWDTSFDFVFERLKRELPTVVCAPYCGPPPHPVHRGEENVYVFYCESDETVGPDEKKHSGYRFEAYSRTHAAQMRGIQPIAAGPTGCIIYSTNAFDLLPIETRPLEDVLIAFRDGKADLPKTLRSIRMQSWFWYEFTDQMQTQKASTEDVTNTREIQLAALAKLGQDAVFCNWDAWAGHWKQKCVGTPEPVCLEHVSAIYQEAVLNPISVREEMREVDFGRPEPIHPLPAEEIPPVPAPAEQPHCMVYGHKIVGQILSSADAECLHDAARELGKLLRRPLRMLVAGNFAGEEVVSLLAGAPEGSYVYCIDSFRNLRHENLAGIKDRARILDEASASDAAKRYLDCEQLDIVVLSDYGDSVWQAISHWVFHLAPHGVLLGAGASRASIRAAAQQWFGELGLNLATWGNTTFWVAYMPAIENARKDKGHVETVSAGHHSV
jgi:hypothetical protein